MNPKDDIRKKAHKYIKQQSRKNPLVMDIRYPSGVIVTFGLLVKDKQ